MSSAVARACANVALAKYWGKRDEALNLPCTGSISITLSGLNTTASVSFRRGLERDRSVLNGAPAAAKEGYRIERFLDLVRERAQESRPAEVELRTDFPVAAGLASSASTFAALALAASHAAGLSLSERELSILARRGSGSAARSIFAGYAEWFPGESADGSDSYAKQLAPPGHWPLGVVIAITDSGPKTVGSREGMSRVVKDSPFFSAWVASHAADLDAIRRGILERDIRLTGQTAERNCLAMHAVSLAARPPLLYWNPVTVAVMQRVAQLREDGLEAYFTIDAGPQVKVICPTAERTELASALAAVPGVRVLVSEPGPAAELIER